MPIPDTPEEVREIIDRYLKILPLNLLESFKSMLAMDEGEATPPVGTAERDARG